MNKEKTFETLKDFILKHLPKLKKKTRQKL